jgi:CHAD domain-containing protein
MDDPARTEYLAGVIESCKSLQAVLGDWHDTVVQLNMLEELEAVPVHTRLAEVVLQRKQQFLSELREILAEQSLFQVETTDPL